MPFSSPRRRVKELFDLDDSRIMRSEGKTEARVNMGERDALTDITETGATLRTNGHIIVAELLISNPQLIANRDATQDKEKLEKMEEIRMCIDAVPQAEREPVYGFHGCANQGAGRS